jgi:hypothetical protein
LASVHAGAPAKLTVAVAVAVTLHPSLQLSPMMVATLVTLPAAISAAVIV